MKQISLIIVPFLVMAICAFFSVSGVSVIATYNIPATTSSGTINGETGSFATQALSVAGLFGITAFVGVALAGAIVAGLNVMGSGVSGSIIPTIFMVSVLSPLFVLLSGLSYALIMSIPIFGVIIYFGCVVAFVTGIATYATGAVGA